MDENYKYFAILDENNTVMNTVAVDTNYVGIATVRANVGTVNTGDVEVDLLINLGSSRSENVMVQGEYSLIQYASNGEIETKNNAVIEGKYFPEIDAFAPKKSDFMDDTWTFNPEILEWEADPEIVYHHISGIPHKWNPETKIWYRVD